MNQWLLVRKLRGPAFLLLVGVIALLAQWHILPWGKSWPLFLILAGLLSLAERAALAQADLEAFGGSTPYAPNPAYPPAPGAPTYGTTGTAIVPAPTTTLIPTDENPEGRP